jgi:CRP/FNR family transcriptional regulator, cyclic AMP receptor protein
MHLEESRHTLMRSSLFQGLKDSYLDIILMICEEARYVAGEYVFREGDPGDSVYLVAQGAVEIMLEPRSDEEKQIPVTILAATSTFGEVTLVEENSRRTASVRCRSDAQLLRLRRDRLLRLCNDYPGIGFRIMRRIAAELATKLRSSNLSIREYNLFSTPDPAGVISSPSELRSDPSYDASQTGIGRGHSGTDTLPTIGGRSNTKESHS